MTPARTWVDVLIPPNTERPAAGVNVHLNTERWSLPIGVAPEYDRELREINLLLSLGPIHLDAWVRVRR